MAELTEAQIREEEKFLKGLPRFNVAAFVMPPIWGMAYGFWATILYYPAWIVLDNLIYLAYSDPTPLAVVAAVLAVVAYIVITVAFSLVSQPIAAHKDAEKGISRETYIKRQRIWAVGMIVVAIIMIAAASYYNIAIRPTLS